MVCYMVPMLVAFAHQVTRKKVKRMNEDPHQSWLSLMLFGGASFGLIDHLWSGELLLIGNLLNDLILGAVITMGIFCAWGIAVAVDKISASRPVASS
jgi:hypothetical protein